MTKIEDGYFHELKPDYLHPNQPSAISYLFIMTRPEEMYFDSINGGTESMWSKCIKTKLILRLIDPVDEMRILY
jgi:hypothetical protein